MEISVKPNRNTLKRHSPIILKISTESPSLFPRRACKSRGHSTHQQRLQVIALLTRMAPLTPRLNPFVLGYWLNSRILCSRLLPRIPSILSFLPQHPLLVKKIVLSRALKPLCLGVPVPLKQREIGI